MAEAFAIFGAVGTSIALLNLACQGFVSLMRTREEFKEAGHHIVDIERRFESTCFNITHWRTFWGLDKDVSTVTLKAFWGEEGCRLIGEHLGAIDIICEDLAAILVPFIVVASYDQIPEEDRKRAQARLKQPARRARRGEPHKSVVPKHIQRILGNRIKESAKERGMKKIRVLKEHVNKATTVTKKAKFVLSSSARLYDYLQALQDEFEQLQANVGWAWRSQHESIGYNATTYKQKRILALAKVHGHILEEAREHREETKILHACCSIREALKLEMDLLRDSTDESRHRRFNMLVPWPDTYVHLEIR
ncbi:hypothetical protein OEA41_007555 [Lepraria neglecta]|uniref:Uncharacterized protein n=1 Tax=Lepraria neglecta TaxID=209136 RepID=A0AAE0DND0_9LECA|nr:hypothetical protein OEA41_007555 [Lepraria neglecta]